MVNSVQAGLSKVLSEVDTTKALENAKKLKELIHVSSSSHITSTHSGRGFKHLFVECFSRVGSHKKENMPVIFQEMTNLLEGLVPDSLNYKNAIMQAARSMVKLFGTEDKVAYQSIAFQNGHGKVAKISCTTGKSLCMRSFILSIATSSAVVSGMCARST